MLKAALKLCLHVERMLIDDLDNLRNEYLTPAEWTELEIIHQFLRPFEQATRACEGDDATLDSTLYTVDFLISHLKKAEARHKARGRHVPQEFLVRTRVAWHMLDKY